MPKSPNNKWQEEDFDNFLVPKSQQANFAIFKNSFFNEEDRETTLSKDKIQALLRAINRAYCESDYVLSIYPDKRHEYFKKHAELLLAILDYVNQRYSCEDEAFGELKADVSVCYGNLVTVFGTPPQAFLQQFVIPALYNIATINNKQVFDKLFKNVAGLVERQTSLDKIYSQEGLRQLIKLTLVADLGRDTQRYVKLRNRLYEAFCAQNKRYNSTYRSNLILQLKKAIFKQYQHQPGFHKSLVQAVQQDFGYAQIAFKNLLSIPLKQGDAQYATFYQQLIQCQTYQFKRSTNRLKSVKQGQVNAAPLTQVVKQFTQLENSQLRQNLLSAHLQKDGFIFRNDYAHTVAEDPEAVLDLTKEIVSLVTNGGKTHLTQHLLQMFKQPRLGQTAFMKTLQQHPEAAGRAIELITKLKAPHNADAKTKQAVRDCRQTCLDAFLKPGYRQKEQRRQTLCQDEDFRQKLAKLRLKNKIAQSEFEQMPEQDKLQAALKTKASLFAKKRLNNEITQTEFRKMPEQDKLQAALKTEASLVVKKRLNNEITQTEFEQMPEQDVLQETYNKENAKQDLSHVLKEYEQGTLSQARKNQRLENDFKILFGGSVGTEDLFKLSQYFEQAQPGTRGAPQASELINCYIIPKQAINQWLDHKPPQFDDFRLAVDNYIHSVFRTSSDTQFKLQAITQPIDKGKISLSEVERKEFHFRCLLVAYAYPPSDRGYNPDLAYVNNQLQLSNDHLDLNILAYWLDPSANQQHNPRYADHDVIASSEKLSSDFNKDNDWTAHNRLKLLTMFQNRSVKDDEQACKTVFIGFCKQDKRSFSVEQYTEYAKLLKEYLDQHSAWLDDPAVYGAVKNDLLNFIQEMINTNSLQNHDLNRLGHELSNTLEQSKITTPLARGRSNSCHAKFFTPETEKYEPRSATPGSDLSQENFPKSGDDVSTERGISQSSHTKDPSQITASSSRRSSHSSIVDSGIDKVYSMNDINGIAQKLTFQKDLDPRGEQTESMLKNLKVLPVK